MENSATYCSSGRKPGRGQAFPTPLLCLDTMSLPSYGSSSLMLVLKLKNVACGLLPVPPCRWIGQSTMWMVLWHGVFMCFYWACDPTQK
jgi:hypothetical protein